VKTLCLWFMKARGWSFVGDRPTARKYVALGAPHTSNWDFLLFLAVIKKFRMPAMAIGKHTLVKPPFGWLMGKYILPVRRDSGQGMVEQMVASIEKKDDITLVVAPKGTRKATDYWRSGFYHIAFAAGIPVVPTSVDYTNKIATVGPEIYLTGDMTSDMDMFREFYAGIDGKFPSQGSPVRLQEEIDE
jgi:1-acyl-sn-glycerol-3-phosphate acyltransferase